MPGTSTEIEMLSTLLISSRLVHIRDQREKGGKETLDFIWTKNFKYPENGKKSWKDRKKKRNNAFWVGKATKLPPSLAGRALLRLKLTIKSKRLGWCLEKATQKTKYMEYSSFSVTCNLQPGVIYHICSSLLKSTVVTESSTFRLGFSHSVYHRFMWPVFT